MENKTESIIPKFKVLLIKRNDMGELHSKYNKNVLEVIKSIPKSRYLPPSKNWLFNMEYFDTVTSKLTENGIKYEFINEDEIDNDVSIASISFKQKTFVLNFPIPKQLKLRFSNTPKILNNSIDQWEFSDEYFMEFYRSCNRYNVIINIV